MLLQGRLNAIAAAYPEAEPTVRGRGMIQGIELGVEGLAQEVIEEAFRRRAIIETSGPTGNVVKFLPSLTIPDDALMRGADIVEEALQAMLAQRGLRSKTLASTGSSRGGSK